MLLSKVAFSRVGDYLEAAISGTADKLIVKDWYLGTVFRVEEFRLGSQTVRLDLQVQGLVGAMAAFGAGSDAEAPPALDLRNAETPT